MKKISIFALAVVFALLPASAWADEATSTPETATTSPSVATSSVAMRLIELSVRSAETLIWSGSVSLPDSDTATTTALATDGSSADIPAASALAALGAADSAADTFAISNLQYFSGWGSFYLKCIAAASELCDNWQYAVNGAFPPVGADKQVLAQGDRVVFFFANPWRVSVATSSIAAGESVAVNAERYDAEAGAYSPAAGATVGAVVFNPDWTTTEIATSSANSAGLASLTLAATGTFQVGISESGYFPTTALAVTDAPLATPAAAAGSSGGGGGGGGGGGSSPLEPSFSVDSALAFLVSKQRSDGSFDDPILSDWAALAFAARSPDEARSRLTSHITASSAGISSVTDYERRAMALLALGVNPYSGASVNYIKGITDAFDGAQIGNPGLVNDDIFALIPLTKAGYATDDPMIQKIAAFVVSKQAAQGAWEGGVDMTAAAVQALAPLRALPGVESALAKAREYLRSQQKSDGGFGNAPATSWAVQAIAALGERPEAWSVNGNTPLSALAVAQQQDGGIGSVSESSFTRVWNTAYAVPAALSTTWHALMQPFPKPAESGVSGAGSGTIAVATTTAAASAFATTTAPTVLANSATTTNPAATAPSSPVATTTRAAPQARATPPQVRRPTVRTAPAATTTPTESVRPIGTSSPSSQPPAQAAAVAASAESGLFSRLWQGIAALFSWLF